MARGQLKVIVTSRGTKIEERTSDAVKLYTAEEWAKKNAPAAPEASTPAPEAPAKPEAEEVPLQGTEKAPSEPVAQSEGFKVSGVKSKAPRKVKK